MTVSLRPATDADRPLLFELYASTREAELAMVPWTAEQKQLFLESQFAAQLQSYSATRPRATHQIICADGEPVGRLYLDCSDNFHILDITVAPARRNQGIGTEVLNRIAADAQRASATVTIYNETFNPSMRLFDRLGFRPKTVDSFLVLLEKPAGA